MIVKFARPIQPRPWRALALASATVTLASMPSFADPQSPALTKAANMGATLWLAAGEGGEAGESGAVSDVSDDVAYLARLSIVEGHMVASFDLYAKGLVDEAIALSYHPEAEMMDEVRASLTAHDTTDITPSMTAFSQALESGATADQARAALAGVQAAIAAAAAAEADEYRTRFDAVIALVRAAASEYADATEDGVVGDVMGFHEAHAFIEVARNLISDLAATPDTQAAAQKVLAALQGADEAFGDMTTAAPVAGDPGILLAVAAKVELAASSVR